MAVVRKYFMHQRVGRVTLERWCVGGRKVEMMKEDNRNESEG